MGLCYAMTGSNLSKAVAAAVGLAGLLLVRGCLYHTPAPPDEIMKSAVRDVVMREYIKPGGSLEEASERAQEIPALEQADVEVLTVYRPFLNQFTRHASRYYVRAVVRWADHELEGCFPVEAQTPSSAVVFSSVALDLCE
jgi:hypothetical protein